MPFIGKDWRSPGFKWVKFDKGWEDAKLIDGLRKRSDSENDQYVLNEILNEVNQGKIRHPSLKNISNPNFHNKCPDHSNIVQLQSTNLATAQQTLAQDTILNSSEKFNSSTSLDATQNGANDQFKSIPPIPLYKPPYIFNGARHYSSPRGFTSLKEAFTKLDFLNGIEDLKRFNYITKVLSLLIKERLPTLSGSGRKCVFALADRVIAKGLSENRNFGLIRALVRDLNKAVWQDCTYGRHIGSDLLWSRHVSDLEEWTALLMENNYIKGPKNIPIGANVKLDLTNSLLPNTMIKLTSSHSDRSYLKNDLEELFDPKSTNVKDASFLFTYLPSPDPYILHENSEKIQIKPPKSTDGTTKVLSDIPRECVFKIVSCLSDHQDLINLSKIAKKDDETALGPLQQECCGDSPQINILRIVYNDDNQLSNKVGASKESEKYSNLPKNLGADLFSLAADDHLVWRKLCAFHFTEQQIARRITATRAKTSDLQQSIDDGLVAEDFIDWQDMYFKLKRYYGVKEIYANMLHFCLGCKCIFWNGLGHPCAYDQIGDRPQPSVRIYPHEFIEIVLY